MWLRSALNEKETELLEVRDQHQRLLVSTAVHMVVHLKYKAEPERYAATLA